MKAQGNQIAIGLSLANCRGQVNVADVSDFIAKQSNAYSAYGFRAGSGITAAALDFYLIFEAVASAASIASVLWQAYDRFIGPMKHRADDNAGIYVAVRRPDGTMIDVCLGRDLHTQEEFTAKFELIVADARDPLLRITHEQTIAEIRSSDYWVKLSGETPEEE